MSEEKTVVTSLEEEGDIAADYLEGLLDIADLDGDIEISVENERAALVIEGGDPKISPQVESYWGNVNPIGIRS